MLAQSDASSQMPPSATSGTQTMSQCASSSQSSSDPQSAGQLGGVCVALPVQKIDVNAWTALAPGFLRDFFTQDFDAGGEVAPLPQVPTGSHK